ncbi:MAG: DsbA family protein [Paracoccus sp. (in: a-proteobacteria)]|nr:DsbA family protein [Paracoccus sp. (in: a-proteobacteria)]
MSFLSSRLMAASLASALSMGAAWAQDATTAETPAQTPAEAPAASAPATDAPAEVTLPAGERVTIVEDAEPEKYVSDIVLGDPDAPLTIVEYASFTCVHCANFHRDVFPQLKSEFIDTGRVQFIQRDVYFDAVGLWAGVLARCAGEERYYAVGGMLLDEQPQWASAQTGEQYAENLRRMGALAGMTTEQMDACWADEAQTERLVATFQRNATADGVQATPTFVIGGEKVANAPWDQLRATIEGKLAEVETAN